MCKVFTGGAVILRVAAQAALGAWLWSSGGAPFLGAVVRHGGFPDWVPPA